MPTQTDYLNLSQAVYTTGGATPVAPSGWTLLQSETLPSGMQAAAASARASWRRRGRPCCASSSSSGQATRTRC